MRFACSRPPSRPRPRRSGGPLRRFSADFRDERGSGVVSFLLLVPIMILFIELIVVGGRVAATTSDVQAAAREAARQATLTNSAGAAQSVTRPVALEFLQNKGRLCLVPSVDTDIQPAFESGGEVAVEVTCVLSIADLGLVPGVPGSITVKRTAVETIDVYRGFD